MADSVAPVAAPVVDAAAAAAPAAASPPKAPRRKKAAAAPSATVDALTLAPAVSKKQRFRGAPTGDVEEVIFHAKRKKNGLEEIVPVTFKRPVRLGKRGQPPKRKSKSAEPAAAPAAAVEAPAS